MIHCWMKLVNASAMNGQTIRIKEKTKGGETMKIKVEAVRKQMEMTQGELAKALGMSEVTYLSRIKKKTDWKAKELALISKMADIPMDAIDFQ